MRRAALVVTGLFLPLLTALPAEAAGEQVICVGSPVGVSCDETAATVEAAIVAANGNTLDDVIRLGAQPFELLGPLQLNGQAHDITLRGSGAGTVLTMPAGGVQIYVSLNHATLDDLTVQMETTTSDADQGIVASNGSVVADVSVHGDGTTNTTGVHASNSNLSQLTVSMAGADTRGFYGEGGNTVADSTISGVVAYVVSADPDNTETLSRLVLRGAAGLSMDGGTIAVDDSLIDLGTTASANGLQIANFNNSVTAKTVTADHLTIVGGGAGSRGVWAYAAAPGAAQSALITLTNAIVEGPATDLVVDAGNGLAADPANVSTARITVSRSSYSSSDSNLGANGAGGVQQGAGNLDEVPGFVSASDFHLTVGSPLVDQGSPTSGALPDLDLNPRIADGDGDGTAVTDMGAYELPDTTPPQTTITAGPHGLVRDATPTFGFASNEAGSGFECRVDQQAFDPCSGPGAHHTTQKLSQGKHTFAVRATDPTGHTDASAATRTFTVDTVAPQTTFTKKPGKRVTTGKVTFTFHSSQAGSRFQCRMDGKAWKACATTTRFTVGFGKHTVRVRATDKAGNRDASPAAYTFKRVRKG